MKIALFIVFIKIASFLERTRILGSSKHSIGNFRRERIGAADVRPAENRREGLEGQHHLQGRVRAEQPGWNWDYSKFSDKNRWFHETKLVHYFFSSIYSKIS